MADPRANAIVVFSADNYNTTRERLMGRQSATEGFLRALVRHGGLDEFWCYCLRREDLDIFRQRVAEFAGGPRLAQAVATMDMNAWSKVGTMYRPGPNIGHFAWLRRGFDQRAFSICGVTHTTAEHVVMDGIAESVLGPVQPWDALVCTSPQVRAMVRHMVDQFADYLMSRFGGKTAPTLELPLIPLGVECDRFDSTTQAAQRARSQMRKQLGIGEQDIAYLFVGRLTHIEKANPLAMYLALEKASKRTKRKLHLIHAGWFASDDIERVFKTAAPKFAPSITHHWLDGRKPEIRNNVWFAGDVFTSLSDNIQETFGLTPIEGMAAGLPCVVSDWDGYRYTVRDGLDGMALPSFMPPPGDGREIAFRYATGMDGYGRYCIASAQSIAIDVEGCAEAYAKLADDAALRRKLGESGRKHARQMFDWSVVMGSYQKLWAEMAAKRAQVEESVKVAEGRPTRPLRDDPFVLFESYPTALIDGATIVEPMAGASATQINVLKSSPLANMMPGLLLDNDGLARLMAHVGKTKSTTVSTLVEEFGVTGDMLRRSVGWLAKNDLIRLKVPAAKPTAKQAAPAAQKPAAKAPVKARR